MNIMLALVSMCLLCGGIGLFAGLHRAHKRRVAGFNRAPKRRAADRVEFPTSLAAALFFLLMCSPVRAQEVIHARTGTVIAVNAADKTMTLKAVDGSTLRFKETGGAASMSSLNKSVREKTVPAEGYAKVGTNVVVLYFGYDNLTAVAIKELGAGALKKSTGSVTSFDRHDRSLTLKTDTAAEQKLVLTDDTIVDTVNGVVKASDYHPSKGEQLRCMTGAESETALLVAPQ